MIRKNIKDCLGPSCASLWVVPNFKKEKQLHGRIHRNYTVIVRYQVKANWAITNIWLKSRTDFEAPWAV